MAGLNSTLGEGCVSDNGAARVGQRANRELWRTLAPILRDVRA